MVYFQGSFLITIYDSHIRVMKKVFKDLNLVDGKYVKRAKFMSSKTCAYMVLHSCCNTFCLPSCKNPIIPLEKWLTSDFSLFALYIPLYKSHYAMQYRNKFTMCSKAICNVASTHIVTSPTPHLSMQIGICSVLA